MPFPAAANARKRLDPQVRDEMADEREREGAGMETRAESAFLYVCMSASLTIIVCDIRSWI
jgi:hypothetical protein